MKNQWQIKFLFVLSSITFLLFNTGRAMAAEDPVEMLKQVTGSVMQSLKDHQENIKQNPNKLYELVDHLILPHVDFVEMARWVVGRNAWKEASPEVQKAFVSQFRTMVVRSYARSLLGYTDQEVEFLPLREPVKNQQRIQVSSLIKDGSQSTQMNYYLLKEADGWRVYDIIIEGVSLVQGYRAQFADDVRIGGVAQAVETMRKHNQEGQNSSE